MKSPLRYFCALFWLIIFVAADLPAVSAQQRPARPRSRYVEVIGEPAKFSAAQAELVKQAQRHAATVADRKLPRGKVAVIKKADHWVQKDQPGELAKVVEDFLASVQ